MKIKFIILVVSCFLLTGCWNYNELNELSIVTGFAVDKANNGYLVSALIANSKRAESSSKEGEAQTTVYSGKGQTLSAALEQIRLKSPKELYIGHINGLIISKDVAEEGILDMADLLMRSAQSRKRFFVLISDNEANAIIKLLSPLESFPSQNIASMVSSTNDIVARSYAPRYSIFISTLLKNGIEPTIGTIKLIGSADKGSNSKNLQTSNPNAYLKVGSLALFKKDKLVEIASPAISNGINIVNNNSSNLEANINCTGGKAVILIENLKSTIKMESSHKFKINVKGKGSLIETSCDIDLHKQEVINELNKKANSYVKKTISNSIKKTQELETDVFGFGSLVYQNKYNEWKKIDDWNKVYSSISIKISTNINVKNNESLGQTLKEEL